MILSEEITKEHNTDRLMQMLERLEYAFDQAGEIDTGEIISHQRQAELERIGIELLHGCFEIKEVIQAEAIQHQLMQEACRAAQEQMHIEDVEGVLA